MKVSNQTHIPPRKIKQLIAAASMIKFPLLSQIFPRTPLTHTPAPHAVLKINARHHTFLPNKPIQQKNNCSKNPNTQKVKLLSKKYEKKLLMVSDAVDRMVKGCRYGNNPSHYWCYDCPLDVVEIVHSCPFVQTLRCTAG